MLVHLHPDNPQERVLKQIADLLRKGGLIIFPTDTIYGIGCDFNNTQAIERICKIKNIQPAKAQFSFICKDLSELNVYAANISNPTFRFLKRSIPGPYTFILNATKLVPKLLKTKKDTVGIRVPDHKISQAIAEALGNPIMSTSLPQNEFVEYYTDPEIIQEQFGHLVDMVIDGGIGNTEVSTVISLVNDEPELIRQGAGVFEP
ncbi:MAG: threonylcarbamoyl-AMP synthase [Sphingobacteriales bacterium]|nr:MAG: threonylcarbamoyl-AMP synthase [Sphingobacteriales bacterium]